MKRSLLTPVVAYLIHYSHSNTVFLTTRHCFKRSFEGACGKVNDVIIIVIIGMLLALSSYQYSCGVRRNTTWFISFSYGMRTKIINELLCPWAMCHKLHITSLKLLAGNTVGMTTLQISLTHRISSFQTSHLTPVAISNRL